jgi:hypothetical protein
VDQFEGIYKEDNRINLLKIVLTTNYFPSFVNEEENERLREEISKDELEIVLDSSQEDKIMGLDGWIVDFFLGFYDFIEDYLIRVVEETRSVWKVLGSFNATFLAFIPNKDNSSSFDEFRPTSL